MRALYHIYNFTIKKCVVHKYSFAETWKKMVYYGKMQREVVLFNFNFSIQSKKFRVFITGFSNPPKQTRNQDHAFKSTLLRVIFVYQTWAAYNLVPLNLKRFLWAIKTGYDRYCSISIGTKCEDFDLWVT